MASLISKKCFFLVIATLQLRLSDATTSDSSPKLFPAAKQERYDPQADLVRTIENQNFEFYLVDTDDHPVLEEAKKRFLDYLTHLPDYPEEYPVNPNNQELVPVLGVKLSVQDKTVPDHLPVADP